MFVAAVARCFGAAFAAAILLASGCASTVSERRAPAPPSPPVSEDGRTIDAEMLPAEIVTVGWDEITGAPIVLLREVGSGKVVPIWVGVAEARAIAAGLHGVKFPRPMTHDLLRGLIERLDAELEEVLVYDIQDGTYYGMLKLRVAGNDEPVWVDTRPSDGMALAVRTGAAISVSKKVVDDTPEFDFLAPEGDEQVVQSLGLTVVSPNESLREELDLPDRQGVVVTRVTGAAADVGMRRGDLVLAVNGVSVSEPVEFLAAIVAGEAGQPIEILFWRQGEELTVELLPRAIDPEEATAGEIALIELRGREGVVLHGDAWPV